MVNRQSTGKSSRPEAPQARAALDSMKYEIAKELGISRSYVSRIEKRALEKLEEALGER